VFGHGGIVRGEAGIPVGGEPDVTIVLVESTSARAQANTTVIPAEAGIQARNPWARR